MKSYRGWARVVFWVELPENDADADQAFQAVTDAIESRLNEREIAYASQGSFSVDEADTEPDE